MGLIIAIGILGGVVLLFVGIEKADELNEKLGCTWILTGIVFLGGAVWLIILGLNNGGDASVFFCLIGLILGIVGIGMIWAVKDR